MRRFGLALLFALLLAAPAGAARLSRVDRAAINRTIDAFVATAVRHEHVAASYELVTPEFRAGITRSAWATGDIPVYPYPARGTSWHGWTLDYALRNDVAFELLLQPRAGAHLDPIAFSGEVKKRHGRWLVDSFYPAASFSSATARVTGPRDFGAPSVGDNGGSSALGAGWLAVPLALLGLVVLVPLAFFILSFRRDRRAHRMYATREQDDEFWERLHRYGSESG